MLSKRILVLMFVVLFLPLVGCFPAPLNQAPILISDSITTATVGVEYIYDVNATDPDGDTLTYSLDVKPSGMTINSATGLIKWTPVAAQVGKKSVVVKISDGDLDITQSFSILVIKPTPSPINHAPVIYSTQITTAIVGVTYVYDVNATDSDGDTLTYFLTTKPGGMSINPASGLIWWTPTTKGSYTVVVNASDGILSDAQSFTIVVSKPTIPVETYTITASAGTGGSISPLGDVTVKKGANISFAIKPNANYSIEKVLVDGVSVGTVSTYPFYNVTKDHTIHATFSAVEPEPEPEIELTGIVVVPKTMDLAVGESEPITSVTATYEVRSHEIPIALGECNFDSDNEGIATVKKVGDIVTVTAVAVGSATITVSYREEKKTRTVYIEETDTIEVTVGKIPLPLISATTGAGTAEWSIDYAHSGSHSVKLYVENGVTDWAEVSIPVDIALGDITELKFWEYIESYASNGWSVNVLLGVDADNDGDFEADVAAWHQGATMHTVAVLNGDSFVQMDGATGSPTTGTWSETDALSIGQWWTPKNVDGPGFAGSDEYPFTFYGPLADLVNILIPSATQNSLIPDADARVKCVKLLIGGSGSWMDETAYVDDITVNSVLYDLEP